MQAVDEGSYKQRVQREAVLRVGGVSCEREVQRRAIDELCRGKCGGQGVRMQRQALPSGAQWTSCAELQTDAAGTSCGQWYRGEW